MQTQNEISRKRLEQVLRVNAGHRSHRIFFINSSNNFKRYIDFQLKEFEKLVTVP